MAPKPADIVLYVGHIARELDVSCALRHLLRRDHGLEMAVCSINFDPYGTIAAHNPKVVAVPWFNEDQDVAIRKARKYWPHAVYLNLAYEQVFQNINKEVKKPHGNFARDEVLHHAWGEFYAEYLVGYGVGRDRIRVNGNPSYALYQEPYRRYFPDRGALAEAHGLDPAMPWLFVPENYGAAFYPDAYVDQMVRWGAPAEQAHGYREFARRSLAEMCRWLRHAADETEWEVVLRPRPYTRLEAFLERVNESVGEPSGRFRVIQQGTVREWILASDVVMTSYSTSLIEAAVAQKPIAMIAPEPIPDFVHNAWYDKVPQIESQPALLGALESRLPGSCGELHAWAVGEMMPSGDPIANMAAWMADAVRLAVSRSSGRVVRGKSALDAKAHQLGRALKGALTHRADKAVAHDRFDQAEVERRTERWARLLG